MSNIQELRTKNQKLKVALDVSQMVYSGHGVARYTEELARALLIIDSPFLFTFYTGALRNRGFFRLRSRQKPWSRATWRLSRLSPRLSSLVWNNTSLPFSLVTGKQDLTHVSDWTHPRASSPVVTTVHDLAFHHYPETVHKIVLRTQRIRLKRAVKQNSHFIADSKSTKNDLMKIYGLKSTQIDVVYPGVGKNFTPQPSNVIKRVKTKYRLPNNYILTLATREPRKNLDRLIEAHQNLRSSNNSTPELVIVGRYGWGEDQDEVEGVTITGFVSDSDLPALYSGASAFIYPSLYEGFGFPVLEAMACGIPVVTSNISSLPEVAGKAGILVDPLSTASIASGITKALKNSKTLSLKSLKQAKKFTWEITARDTIKIYKKLCK